MGWSAPGRTGSSAASPVLCVPSSRSLIEELDRPAWRHRPERLLTDALDLVPVDHAVQTHSEPTPDPDVRRTEEPVRFRFDEFVLNARKGGTPHLAEPFAVVPVGPEGHELPSREERGGSVTRLLRDARKPVADQANPCVEPTGLHGVNPKLPAGRRRRGPSEEGQRALTRYLGHRC